MEIISDCVLQKNAKVAKPWEIMGTSGHDPSRPFAIFCSMSFRIRSIRFIRGPLRLITDRFGILRPPFGFP